MAAVRSKPLAQRLSPESRWAINMQDQGGQCAGSSARYCDHREASEGSSAMISRRVPPTSASQQVLPARAAACVTRVTSAGRSTQSGAARCQRLRQERRHEVRTGRTCTACRSHLLHAPRPSAQRGLHRPLSAATLQVRQAEPAVGPAALLQIRRQAYRQDNRD
jgi:hypothetical protein